MTWRLDDWACEKCGSRHEEMTDKADTRRAVPLLCQVCGEETPHIRLMSAPAPYRRERIQAHENVRIKGGKYDTEGFKQGPRVPDLPGADEADAKTAAALAALPSDASPADRDATLREASRDSPSGADYIAHMRKPEIMELSREHKAIAEANAQKRMRAKLIDAGQTTVAKSPLPCDAKELHK